jgi:hypothetical protein
MAVALPCEFIQHDLPSKSNCWMNKTMPNSYRIFKEHDYAYFVTWTLVDWLPYSLSLHIAKLF